MTDTLAHGVNLAAQESSPRRSIVWTIAGSDSGAGAGLQADLRAMQAMGVHGCSVVAAVTAQNSVAVTLREAVAPDLVRAQLQALRADMPPAAIKTGMLGSVANLHAVVEVIDALRQHQSELPLVVDPVLGASTGSSFVDDALLQAYRTQLLPRASLITPNRAEAARLLGCAALDSSQAVEKAAHDLQAMGAKSVAITGGDLLASDNTAYCMDYMRSCWSNGWLWLPRIATPHNHGTGCVFASSAAAAMALGFVDADAVVLGKMATHQALLNGYAAGSGAGPVAPHAGFALQSASLPSLLAQPLQAQLQFTPLRDAAMGLYAVVDSASWVERVLAAGVRTVQLRVKDPDRADLRQQVRASIAAAQAANAQLFINDHWQIALEEGAYGIHLGQEDLASADLAAIAKAGLRLGISTHCYWEVARAAALRPSYIACGPIHPTAAKAMPWVAQGNNNLAYWCHVLHGLQTPVVAIGGMDSARARQAAACGADSVAVISAITAAANTAHAVAALQQAIAQGHNDLAWPVPVLPRSSLAAGSTT